MSTTPHPRAQLSAYLDGALSPVERAAVDAHLASCDECRTRLGELRATARLIASLPSPAPSRRLVPRIAAVPAWLAPLRTLSTLASGVAVFLFIATALLANIGTLATSSSTTASQVPALAPFGGAAAPPAPSNAARSVAGSAPVPAAAQDTAKLVASASPSAEASRADIAAAPTVHAASDPQPVAREIVGRGTIFAMPWLWLVIAVLTGVVAIVLQRRLRSA